MLERQPLAAALLFIHDPLLLLSSFSPVASSSSSHRRLRPSRHQRPPSSKAVYCVLPCPDQAFVRFVLNVVFLCRLSPRTCSVYFHQQNTTDRGLELCFQWYHLP